MNHSHRNSWSRRLLLVLGGLALLQCSKAHADTATLSSGSIVNGTNFQFTLNTTSSTNWNIMTSSNLISWSSIGTLTTTGGPATFVETNLNRFFQFPRFYRANVGSEYSDSIGYIHVKVPGRTSLTNDATGFVLTANQLNNEAGSNTLNVLMPVVPDGTTVTKYDVVSQGLASPSVYSVAGGGWTPSGAATLNPGEGAFVQNPTTNDFTITFIGKVPTGPQTVTIGQGYNLVSSPVPQPLGLDVLSFPGIDDNQFSGWNVATQQYDPADIFFGGAWLNSVTLNPETPRPGVGEAFFIFNPSTNSQTWSHTFSFAP